MTEPKKSERQFETEIEIAAPRDAVWSAIANDTELSRWFAPVAAIDCEVGGEIVWEWGEHHRWAHRVELVEPGQRLRTRYDSGVDDGHGGKKPLFVDFLLEGDGGLTTLRLVQSGFGSEAGFEEEYDGISNGWPVELRSLRLYLEQHAGRDRRLAWSTCDVDMDPASAWQRLAGAEGLGCGVASESPRDGQPFDFTTVDGDAFSGTTFACHPRAFCGDAKSHGGAFLRASVEEWGGKAHVWCWLGAYELAQSALSDLQGRWDAMLGRLFVAKSETASEGARS